MTTASSAHDLLALAAFFGAWAVGLALTTHASKWRGPWW